MVDLNLSHHLAARPRGGCFLGLLLLAVLPAIRAARAADMAATNTPGAIPWNQSWDLATQGSAQGRLR